MTVPGRVALLLLLAAACFRDVPPQYLTGAPGSSDTGGSSSGTGTSGTAGPVTGSSTLASTSTSGGEPDSSGTSGATGCTPSAWYLDLDRDGHGDPESAQLACEAPPGHVELGDDCDDGDASRAPGLLEQCDDRDNDCDLLVDEHSEKNPSCKGCALLAIGASSYALCEFKRSYKDARLECHARGGDLAVIDDARENLALAKQANALQGAASRWSIGINDIVSEGKFVWLDGDPVSFTSWVVGEPNNSGGDEDCGELYAGSGNWNDQQCSLASFFICEATPP